MCVYCEITESSKEAFYNAHPELKDNDDIVRLQINIMGDPGCGKTTLIDKYGAEHFPSITPVSRYACYKLTKVNNRPAEIILNDIIGCSEHNDAVTRSLMFKFSEVTILCYSVCCRESFANISTKWFPEISASETTHPFILVGLKKDLRYDNKPEKTESTTDFEHVKLKEGRNLAKSIGASDFLECSAVTGQGVQDIFEIAIQKTLSESKGERKRDGKDLSWRHLCCFSS